MSSGGAFFFLRRVALVVGVLLSSKSCFSCWGTAFFEEFTLFGGVLACFLRRVAWLLGLLGLLRGGLLSLAFSVSINKLKIYRITFQDSIYNFGCWDFSLELQSGLGFVVELQF